MKFVVTLSDVLQCDESRNDSAAGRHSG